MTLTPSPALDAISIYFREIGKHPVLTREEERALFQRLEEGDESARERLVVCNLRFVVKMALRFRGRGVPLPDLIQEGNIGLLEVISRFDWRRGFRFTTYASFWIRQGIQRAVLKSNSLVRLPIRKARLMGRLRQATRETVAEHGRDPSVEEMAEAIDANPQVIRDLLPWREGVLSLDTPSEGECAAPLVDCLAAPEEHSPLAQCLRRERHERLNTMMEKRLSECEQSVLRMRRGFDHGEPMNLRMVSARVGLSPEGVRHVEDRALRKLQRAAEREELACVA